MFLNLKLIQKPLLSILFVQETARYLGHNNVSELPILGKSIRDGQGCATININAPSGHSCKESLIQDLTHEMDLEA